MKNKDIITKDNNQSEDVPLFTSHYTWTTYTRLK